MTPLCPLSDFSGRLVTLNNGQAGIRGGIHIDIREPGKDAVPSVPDQAQPVLDFISSDESLDRYNEVISAAGWKLDNYRRNPVFQNAHQTGDIMHTLGRAVSTEVREGKLFQRIEFACDINPMARIAYGLYRGKFLNAVSVGFVPGRWENGTEKTGYTRIFLEQELLEVSAVAIPANPHALALGLKSGAIEKSDLKDVLDLFRRSLSAGGEGRGEVDSFSSSSSSFSNFRPQPSNLNHQLAALARDFHRLIKS